FSCVAPGKRFTRLENLSGGEKTLAALALVFSLGQAGYQKDCDNEQPSLFILDEVDAALDAANVQKLCNFIEKKKKDRSAQFLLISLKSDLYQNADSLFGLYKSSSSTR
ncbi:MAG: Structural maintenance of chromosomes protein 1, partial [Paramarteilia canceri]